MRRWSPDRYGLESLEYPRERILATMVSMRLMYVFLALIMVAGEVATAQDFPIEYIMENEAQDVEVCHDYLCDRLREEILVEATKCIPLASFKRRRMHVRRTRAANS